MNLNDYYSFLFTLHLPSPLLPDWLILYPLIHCLLRSSRFFYPWSIHCNSNFISDCVIYISATARMSIFFFNVNFFWSVFFVISMLIIPTTVSGYYCFVSIFIFYSIVVKFPSSTCTCTSTGGHDTRNGCTRWESRQFVCFLLFSVFATTSFGSSFFLLKCL
jgi:hypothetical protein